MSLHVVLGWSYHEVRGHDLNNVQWLLPRAILLLSVSSRRELCSIKVNHYYNVYFHKSL